LLRLTVWGSSANFAVNAPAGDEETTWFEGVLLIGVYLLSGIGFYFVT
jgi:Ca2+:H+ antiporter